MHNPAELAEINLLLHSTFFMAPDPSYSEAPDRHGRPEK